MNQCRGLWTQRISNSRAQRTVAPDYRTMVNDEYKKLCNDNNVDNNEIHNDDDNVDNNEET